jgi:hypothetical protein
LVNDHKYYVSFQRTSAPRKLLCVILPALLAFASSTSIPAGLLIFNFH